MTMSGGNTKKAEKMVTKVGRSLGMMKARVVEWMVGPTPGVPRAAIDWKMEAFEYTKIVVQKWVRNETMLLQRCTKCFGPTSWCMENRIPLSWPRLLLCFCIMTAKMGS